MTETASTGADPDRVRHRRLAGQDRRRVHVRERPPLRRRRRALRRGARRAGEGRRHRLRPAVRRRSTSRAAAAEVLLAHDIPVAFASHAVPTQMSSYEVVERGSAAGIVITASHNPWTDNGFKVKSPTGAAAGPEILAVIEAAIAANGGSGHRASAVRGRGGGRPRRVVRPVRGVRAVRRPDARPRRAQGGRRVRARRADVGRRRRLDPAPAGRRPDPGHRDPQGAQPVLRRHQPRADPAQRRRGAGDASPAAATTWACSSTATRTAPARPTSAGRSSTSSRSRAC